MTVAKMCELDCLTLLLFHYCLRLKGISGTWVLETLSLSSYRQKGAEDVKRFSCSDAHEQLLEETNTVCSFTRIKGFLLS